MKFPIQAIGKLGKQLGENEYLLPVLYFAGAAGGLAYGAYALVDHARGPQRGVSAGKVAKIGLPVLVGSGLAVLGVRDLRAAKPLIAEAIGNVAKARHPRAARRVARARARSRIRSSAAAAM